MEDAEFGVLELELARSVEIGTSLRRLDRQILVVLAANSSCASAISSIKAARFSTSVSVFGVKTDSVL
jgi:hypothetical protein